jgi:hypothetical protein
VSAVPRWVTGLLAASLVVQLGVRAQTTAVIHGADDLPPVPSPALLRIFSMGEAATLGRVGMIYLQSFDYHGSNSIPYRKLDYHRLIGWLSSLQQIDPLNAYPLFAAARIYTEVPDPNRLRLMLDFIYVEFLKDPNRRWPWAAHAALVAKHRLKDSPLALKYAAGIDQMTTVAEVPLWAKQMQVFILEDLNEFDAARIMLGGLLTSGRIKDAGERRFLEDRLEQLERRVNAVQ